MSEQPTTVPTGIGHHWILTAQFPDGVMKTYSNTFTPNLGATRSEIFNALVNSIKEQRGVDALVVLYFDFTPNDLPGGAR